MSVRDARQLSKAEVLQVQRITLAITGLAVEADYCRDTPALRAFLNGKW